ENTAWMLQCRVGVLGLNWLLLYLTGPGRRLARSCRGLWLNALVHPGALIIPALGSLPAAEQAVAVFRVGVLVIDNRRGVRIIYDILFEVTFVLDDVTD